ncbi:septum formation family protein [Aquihabitans sp. McL0605]|uniref:septum formation family protein n=1 Tax=Aquihabitans sp. McL0605 TaxID=3415671 RepID=UPI003CE8DF30
MDQQGQQDGGSGGYGTTPPGWVPPPGPAPQQPAPPQAPYAPYAGAYQPPPPGPYPGAHPGQPVWAPPQKRKRFGWGSLIAAFFVGGLLATGVIIGVLALLVVAFGTPDTIANTHPGAAEGAEVAKVGDCLRNSPETAVVADRSQVIDCDGLHGSEVTSVVVTPGARKAPGHDNLASFADDACAVAFEDYVGSSVDDSGLDYAAVAPDASAWAAGDRRIWCLADTTTLDVGEGSVRNSHR